MNPSDLIALLLTQAWQLAALVGGVLLVNRLLAKDRPHLAHALWLVVLLKCITPPLWSSPSGVFCWLQPTHFDAADPVANEQVAWQPQQRPAALPVVTGDVVVAMSPMPRGDEFAPVLAAGPPPAAWNWPQWLVFVWLGGILLWLVIALVRWCGFLWRLHRCPRRDEPVLTAFTERLARRLRIGRRVRLLITESRIGPAVIGLWRPTILLPEAIVDGKAPAELEPILAHELLHVRRGDLWLAAAQLLAQALWWFHPLVWLANRLLTREAERCCDEQVLAELRCEPARYARSLLDILQLKQQLVAVPAFPGVRPVDVTSNRLERIMRLGHGCRARTPWWCWLIMLLAAALALPGAALVGGAKEPPHKLSPPRSAPAHAVPSADTDTGSAETGEQVQRVYHVRDLIQRLTKELKADESTAKDDVRGHVIGFARLKTPQLSWDGDSLVASHSEATHEQIAAALEQLREFGVRQVVLTVRMISGPPEMLEMFPIQWSAAGSSPPQPADKPASMVSAAFDYRPLPQPAEAQPGQSWTQATSVVETNLPVLYALLDQSQTRTLVVGVQKNRKTMNFLFAPKVTVFNGQRATVMDATQRPFVVGVKAIATANPEAPASFEPQIRVVDEGTTLRMRPVLQGQDRVRLDYEFTLASVRKVETAKIPQGAGKQPLTVQVPEVASTRFSSSLTLPLDQNLAVGVLTKQGAKPAAMIVLVEANEIDLAAENQAAATAAKNAPVLPSPRAIAPPRAVAPATYLKGDVIDLRRAPQEPQTVAGRLAGNIAISPGTMTLEEALEAIGKAAGVSIWLDTRALAAQGVKPNREVTFERPTAPVSANALLKQLLEPLVLEHSVENEAVRVTSRGQPASKTYTKVYSVADLLADAPAGVVLDGSRPTPFASETHPRFKPLVDRIVNTIAPRSWQSAGGDGAISAYVTNLSLVVSQTQEVHEQIADLLAGLRRLREQQVTLEIQVLTTPDNIFERTGLDFEFHAADSDSSFRHAILGPSQAAALAQAADAKRTSQGRLALLHGEKGELDLAIDGNLHKVNFKFLPRKLDGQRTRVNVAVGEGQLAATSRGTLIDCTGGRSLLLDVTDSVPVIGIPMLSNIPHLNRVFKQSPPEGSRVLLLVTPTMLGEVEQIGFTR